VARCAASCAGATRTRPSPHHSPRPGHRRSRLNTQHSSLWRRRASRFRWEPWEGSQTLPRSSAASVAGRLRTRLRSPRELPRQCGPQIMRASKSRPPPGPVRMTRSLLDRRSDKGMIASTACPSAWFVPVVMHLPASTRAGAPCARPHSTRRCKFRRPPQAPPRIRRSPCRPKTARVVGTRFP